MLELLLIIVKIIILSTIYATLVLLTVFVLSKVTNIQWTKKRMAKKVRFWLLTHFIISVLLFALSFSYWQDTGIGDNSKIPAGYGQTIQSEDFAWTYFYPDPDKTEANRDELIIGKYKIADPFFVQKFLMKIQTVRVIPTSFMTLKIKASRHLVTNKNMLTML